MVADVAEAAAAAVATALPDTENWRNASTTQCFRLIERRLATIHRRPQTSGTKIMRDICRISVAISTIHRVPITIATRASAPNRLHNPENHPRPTYDCSKN